MDFVQDLGIKSLVTKSADEIRSIKNIGWRSEAEIQSKLKQYLEVSSISVSELLLQVGKSENSIGSSSAPLDSEIPAAVESSQPIVEATDSVILSTSKLLELTLLQAVRYPQMTLEGWGDLLVKCKIQGLIKAGLPDGVSVYGRSMVPLDQNFDKYLSVRTRRALERVGIYDTYAASRARVRELAAIRQFGRNSTIELLSLLKSELPNLGSSNPRVEIDEPESERASLETLVNDLSPEHQRLMELLRTWTELKQGLNAELREGRLHPQVRVKGLTIVEWLREDVEQIDERYAQTASSRIESSLRYTTIDDELQEPVNQLDSRQTAILIARFGQFHQTLQELADRFGLTRERIRQLEQKAKDKVTRWLSRYSPCRLQTTLLLAEEMGNQISLPQLASTLIERNLMTKMPLLSEKSLDLELNSLDLALVLLRANEDGESPADEFRIPNNLRSVLDHPSLTANEVEVSKALPKKELRAIRRQCRNAGAVSAILLSRKLKIPVATIGKALSAHGYTQLDKEWLTLKQRPGTPISSHYSAFQVNVMKMLTVCGALSVEEARQGLENHVSRFGFAIPPTFVLRKLLPMYGFKVDDHDRIALVRSKGSRVTSNSGEKIILDFIKERGPIITFQELLEEYSRQRRSQPLLSTTLRHSVLLMRVDTGLYALRGTKITREDVEAAVARRPVVEQDGLLQFSSNGIITWEINIGTYGLGGTIPSGEAAKLFGEWKTATGDADAGRIKVGEQRIWGLAKAFRKLGVKVGDRVALRFDPELRMVQVVKLERKENEEN